MSYLLTNYLTDQATYFDFLLFAFPQFSSFHAETSRSRYPTGWEKNLSLLTLVIQLENVSEASSKCFSTFVAVSRVVYTIRHCGV